MKITDAVKKYGDNWKLAVARPFRYTERSGDWTDSLAMAHTGNCKGPAKTEALGHRMPTFAISIRGDKPDNEL